jgi:hypothetical protein
MIFCAHCGELIEGPTRTEGLHDECAFRLAAGSLGHLQRICSCYVPGSIVGDPPGMTARQAAQAALEHYRKQAVQPLQTYVHKHRN